jgi:hypothetical protein
MEGCEAVRCPVGLARSKLIKQTLCRSRLPLSTRTPANKPIARELQGARERVFRGRQRFSDPASDEWIKPSLRNVMK